MQIIFNVKTLDKKRPGKSTLIIRTLKNFGIRGDHALLYFTKNSGEYLLRKCWLLDYYIDINKAPRNKTAWLKSAIEHDYAEPEAFHDWFKKKREKILNGNNEDLKELV
jgi:hypothetical protein